MIHWNSAVAGLAAFMIAGCSPGVGSTQMRRDELGDTSLRDTSGDSRASMQPDAAEPARAAEKVDAMAVEEESWEPSVRVDWEPNAALGAKQNLLNLLALLAARKSNHWLLTKHFQSVAAMLQAPETVGPDGNEPAPHDPRLLAMIDAFRGDASNFATYRAGKRLLIISWVSPFDGVTTFFRLALPANWDESREDYPLFVILHGVGATEDPARRSGLKMLSEYFQGAAVIGSASTPRVPSTAFTRRRGGFVIEIFGRGDAGYKTGGGRADVYESVAEFEKILKADKANYFLHGFSLGGMGTLFLAAEKALQDPKYWRAAAPFSCKDEATVEQAEALKNTPLFLVVGDSEPPRTEATRTTRDRLKAASGGKQPERYEEMPNTGHAYKGAYQELIYDWMMGMVQSP